MECKRGEARADGTGREPSRRGVIVTPPGSRKAKSFGMGNFRGHLVRVLLGLALFVVGLFPMVGVVRGAGRTEGSVKEFHLTARRFAFEPARLEVTEGDTVRIVVRSADITHGFEIKPFKIKREVPTGGAELTIEFVASQAGSFEIRCTEYCGKGHKGMTATLVVGPRAQP